MSSGSISFETIPAVRKISHNNARRFQSRDFGDIRLFLESLAHGPIHSARSIQILDMVDVDHSSWLVIFTWTIGPSMARFSRDAGYICLANSLEIFRDLTSS